MSNPGQQILIGQKRARFAYEAINRIRNANSTELAQGYRTLALALPVQVLRTGLGQTVAFYMSKAKGDDKSAHGRLLIDLNRWLTGEQRIFESALAPIQAAAPKATEKLMDSLVNCDRPQWIKAQAEAIELAQWLKKFAESLLIFSGDDQAQRTSGDKS